MKIFTATVPFALAFSLTQGAQAVPVAIVGLPVGVVGSIDDTPFEITVTLSGGEVADDTDAGPLNPNPAGNWPITFTLTKEDRDKDATPAADFVVVSGTVFHSFDPHAGEDNGDVINFAFNLTPPNNPLINIDGVEMPFENIKMVDHEGHKDRYRLTALFARVGNNIISWSLTLNGRHPRVPEPATLGLLGLGLLGLGAARRRKSV